MATWILYLMDSLDDGLTLCFYPTAMIVDAQDIGEQYLIDLVQLPALVLSNDL